LNKSLRIAIVNDRPIAIEALRRVIVSVPHYTIAWIAESGTEAVTQAAIDRPDIILMDLLMPGLNGVEATRQIMAQSPCAILLVTGTVSSLGGLVFEAMGYGALDAVNTPILGRQGQAENGSELLRKIDTIARLIGKSSRSVFTPIPHRSVPPPLIIIGASTGGPQVLRSILKQFPAQFPAAIVIIQHIDAQFAPGFVDWLNQQIPLPAQIARTGDSLKLAFRLNPRLHCPSRRSRLSPLSRCLFPERGTTFSATRNRDSPDWNGARWCRRIAKPACPTVAHDCSNPSELRCVWNAKSRDRNGCCGRNPRYRRDRDGLPGPYSPPSTLR
jgi:CheY-like chemotaxis protein